MPSSDPWPQLDNLDRLEWAFVDARLGSLGWEVVRSFCVSFVTSSLRASNQEKRSLVNRLCHSGINEFKGSEALAALPLSLFAAVQLLARNSCSVLRNLDIRFIILFEWLF